MKPYYIIVTLLMGLMVACQMPARQTTNDSTSAVTIEPGVTTLVYFHLERRCATCNAVEKESKQVLETHFGELFQSGQLRFQSLNYNQNKALATQLGAKGQCLLLVNDTVITNLTTEAFLLARNQPEQWHQKLIEAISSQL